MSLVNKGPSILVANNDSEAIILINQLSGNNYVTIGDALSWVVNQDNILVQNRSIEDIVTEGIVIYLDAGSVESYPKKGSVWFDLSGNENHCNFVNSPTHNNTYFSFDGVDEYGVIINNSTLNFSSEKTQIMWLRHNYTSGRRNPWDQAYGGYGTWTHEQGNAINEYFGDSGANAAPYVGRSSSTTPRNVWNFLATTRDTAQQKWYVNNVNTSTYNHSYGVLTTTTADIRIGRGYAGYWVGDMGMVLVYNRKLSDTEISQVYNATKSRFGL